MDGVQWKVLLKRMILIFWWCPHCRKPPNNWVLPIKSGEVSFARPFPEETRMDDTGTAMKYRDLTV